MAPRARKSLGDGGATPSPASKKARMEDYLARPTMLPNSEVGVELMKQWMSRPH